MAYHVASRRTVSAVALTFALTLASSLLSLGCGSDSTGPGGSPANFQGAWSIEGVVTAKSTCDNELDDVLQWDVRIAQNGNDAQYSRSGARPLELEISGSTATTSFVEDNSTIDVSITVSGNELTGSVNSRALDGAESRAPRCCRSPARASRIRRRRTSRAAGICRTEVTSASCTGVIVGSMESICREVVLDGSAISIDDPDGTIFGVATGNFRDPLAPGRGGTTHRGAHAWTQA